MTDTEKRKHISKRQATLRQAADKLGPNEDEAQYQSVVLALPSLTDIAIAFSDLGAKLTITPEVFRRNTTGMDT
jgi:hypothetical protein